MPTPWYYIPAKRDDIRVFMAVKETRSTLTIRTVNGTKRVRKFGRGGEFYMKWLDAYSALCTRVDARLRKLDKMLKAEKANLERVQALQIPKKEG